jgi:hypothetical protein
MDLDKYTEFSKRDILDKVSSKTMSRYMHSAGHWMYPHRVNDARDKMLKKIASCLDIIFDNAESITKDQFIEELPLIAHGWGFAQRLVYTDEVVDMMLKLGNDMNIVMKTDQMTPKEKREVYDLKKDMIREILLHRKDRIVSAQFQVRESDGFEFMFYKIRTSTDTVYLFHQPWRNVKNLYRPYEYKNMSQNPEPYEYVPYPDIDLDAHKTAAKFFLYVNYARVQMCRDFYAVDENCPDEHWREIAREIY